jgi:hypothetical protein
MSYKEEDTCMSYEEEDTCMPYERTVLSLVYVCSQVLGSLECFDADTCDHAHGIRGGYMHVI